MNQPKRVTAHDIIEYHWLRDNCSLCTDYAQRRQQPAPKCPVHRQFIYLCAICKRPAFSGDIEPKLEYACHCQY